MVTTVRGAMDDQRGFTLVEMMIASAITGAVVGAALMMATSVQTAYSYEMDDAAVQQEARFALDWIGRTLSAAGSNPYDITTSACPTAGTAFDSILLDPDGDSIHDDIRVQADVNPPNGLLGGLSGACNEEDEDITIAHDPVNLVITRRNNADAAGTAAAVTDGVISQLRFTYLTSSRVVTTNPNSIAYIQVNLTGQSKARNPYTDQLSTYTYQSEIRVRGR